MFLKNACHVFLFIIFIFPIFSVARESQMAEATIYSNSIKWEDETGKSKLLEQVTLLHDDIVKALFDSYLHPERFQLPNQTDSHKYNVQFLNAMFGPLDNPFNKYPRLVKAFIFLNKSESEVKPELFFMSPIAKNSADGNYYIFNKLQSHPQLLNDWVNEIRNKYGYHLIVKFNICNGYGNLPTDSCTTKSYQNETADIYGPSITQNKSLSAHRDIHEDWKTKIKKTGMKNGSIFDESISWEKVESRNVLLNTVTTWPNYKIIKENFEKIRNLRYFDDEEYRGFLRRISWLYPDDGCWTRASAVIRDLFGPFNNLISNYPRPSKLFAFGNLCAVTPNSPDGKVTWWYHTAPIVRDAQTNQTFVLDPSVNPYEPLPVEKWMKEVSSQSGPCSSSHGQVDTFNICNGYGTGPQDVCHENYLTEAESMLEQSSYRHEERARQKELGRDANKVLGDQPPWETKMR